MSDVTSTARTGAQNPTSSSGATTEPPETLRLLAGAAAFTSGFAMFFSLPLFVGAAADTLGLDARDQGFLAAMDQGGMCIAGLVSVAWVGRWSWRRVGAIGQLALGLTNLACLTVDDLGHLYSLRLLTGFCAGTVYAAGLAAIGTLRDTQRGFAISITLQISFASAAFYLLSGWVDQWGFDAVLWYLGAVALLLLAPMRWIPHGPRPEVESDSGRVVAGREERAVTPEGVGWKGFAGLAGFGVMAIGVGTFWAFVERMGVDAGLDAHKVGAALATSLLTSIAGPLIASWAGTRWGSVVPILTGFGCSTLAMGLMMQGGSSNFVAQFTAAAIGFQFGWNFAVPYIFALIAQSDRRGRLITVSVAVQMAGGALGPATGGIYLQTGGYSAVTVAASVAFGLAFLLLLPVALKERNPKFDLDSPL